MTQRTLNDRYEVKRSIGRGSFSAVYLAFDTVEQQDVAIKLLPREFIEEPDRQEAFERHIHDLTRLEHEGIVPVYGSGLYADQPYIVSAYYEQPSLLEQIRLGPMSLLETAHCIDDIAFALNYAHTCGMVHRDLKPSNVLFDANGRIGLADFGLVQFSRPFARVSGTAVMGTPAYIAPEMSQTNEMTPLTDIYLLGVLFFHLLAGRPPYDGSAVEVLRAHLEQPIPSLRISRPDLPEGVQAIVMSSLAKDPLDR
nr:serine/threonine protein kinase [Anaerolineae bacterium]